MQWRSGSSNVVERGVLRVGTGRAASKNSVAVAWAETEARATLRAPPNPGLVGLEIRLTKIDVQNPELSSGDSSD